MPSELVSDERLGRWKNAARELGQQRGPANRHQMVGLGLNNPDLEKRAHWAADQLAQFLNEYGELVRLLLGAAERRIVVASEIGQVTCRRDVYYLGELGLFRKEEPRFVPDRYVGDGRDEKIPPYNLVLAGALCGSIQPEHFMEWLYGQLDKVAELADAP
jgi:hypothetical protein